MVDSRPRQQWLQQAVEKGLREELAKLLVEVNEEKSRGLAARRELRISWFRVPSDSESPGTMDAAVIAERQEADGFARQAHRDFPGLSFPAGGRCDQEHQSSPARLGEVLRYRPLESVFLLHPIWLETRIRLHLDQACRRRGCGWKRWISAVAPV